MFPTWKSDIEKLNQVCRMLDATLEGVSSYIVLAKWSTELHNEKKMEAVQQMRTQSSMLHHIYSSLVYDYGKLNETNLPQECHSVLSFQQLIEGISIVVGTVHLIREHAGYARRVLTGREPLADGPTLEQIEISHTKLRNTREGRAEVTFGWETCLDDCKARFELGE